MDDNRLTLFISHVSEDEELANALKSFLEGMFLNINVFVSGKDLVGGDLWAEGLRTKLQSSTAIIALITENSRNSNWVHFEAGAGFIQRSTIPVVIGSVTLQNLEPPLGLLQARTCDEDGIKKLAQDVASLARLRKPDKYPGLTEFLDKCTSLITSTTSSTLQLNKATPPSKTNVPDKHAHNSENADYLSCVSLFESLLLRAKSLVIRGILLAKPTFNIPSRDELKKMDYDDLLELAEAVGANPPSISTGTLRMGRPYGLNDTDKSWKFINYRNRLIAIESTLDEYESRLNKHGA